MRDTPEKKKEKGRHRIMTADTAYSSAQPVALSVDGLLKTFGRKTAVDNLHLDVPEGSFYGIVGPNGAGKTTTLQMCTGMLLPSAGHVSLFGKDVWENLDEARAVMGVMPQADEIFDRLTGRQLLIYVGLLHGMKREESRRRADDLMAAFGLADAGKKIVADYSTGMKKKICLAVAMIHSPRILFLDEPFEAVDPVSSANLRDILKGYVAGGGTVVISSHVMALVEKMCSHVAIIAEGTVRAAGTLEEVSAGEELEDRFFELVGGRQETAHFDWLQGGEQE
ncbi:ABC transporter [Alloscardovia macacae]|uniref:ABC transporter n=2 Tax=Alloscardovia macacae TaxID=1160091 RepID=A0A1Y2SZ59_9BIFI|nr:ABC transporter [Alloscardovia macacae]OTA29389.1 ABC transporter [Alloscardovia macacae]